MATTLNDSYLSNPMTVAQGGFGVASNTAYSLLAAGTTATGAIQSVGAPSANTTPVSGGASTLATNTTSKTITTMQLISTQTASSSASIAFTGLSSTYFGYRLIIDSIVPATNAANLLCTLSGNNGSSYFSANYNFAYTGANTSGATLDQGTAASSIAVAASVSNTASSGNNFEITILQPSVVVANNGIYWNGRYKDTSSSTVAVNWGMGIYTTSSLINAIKFAFSSGNISSGVFKLYGILT